MVQRAESGTRAPEPRVGLPNRAIDEFWLVEPRALGQVVRNDDDLRALAQLVKRLLKRETTLKQEFPGYCYTKADWERDRPEPNLVHMHTLSGTLPKPDKPVSIDAMNNAIVRRGAGLLKGQIEMAEDFDAPLPDDIQAGFDGTSQPWVRTPEEQAWLDMAPVGREFGSPDHDRLMEIDAQKERDKENE